MRVILHPVIWVPVLTLIFWAAVVACAAAQTPQCAPVDEMAKDLAKSYGERLRIVLRAAQGVMMVFENQDTGTWTMVASGPVNSCIVIVGKGVTIEAPGVDG